MLPQPFLHQWLYYAMNFLVHAWLSYPDKELTWGNLYADSFKGSSYLQLNKSQQMGVVLHRNIDLFTDTHPKVLEIIQSVRPYAGRLAPAYVDVAFDYWLFQFLKINNEKPTTLIKFIHEVLLSHPPKKGKVVNMLPYIIEGEWLKNYESKAGILSAFKGLKQRMALNVDAEKSVQILLENKSVMAFLYNGILKDLQKEMQAFIPN